MFENNCIKTYSQRQETIAVVLRDRDGRVDGFGHEGPDEGLRSWSGGAGEHGFECSESITARRVAGQIRHIEVRELRVQDRVAKGSFPS